jgi:hypothetical protein
MWAIRHAYNSINIRWKVISNSYSISLLKYLLFRTKFVYKLSVMCYTCIEYRPSWLATQYSRSGRVLQSTKHSIYLVWNKRCLCKCRWNWKPQRTQRKEKYFIRPEFCICDYYSSFVLLYIFQGWRERMCMCVCVNIWPCEGRRGGRLEEIVQWRDPKLVFFIK